MAHFFDARLARPALVVLALALGWYDAPAALAALDPVDALQKELQQQPEGDLEEKETKELGAAHKKRLEKLAKALVRVGDLRRALLLSGFSSPDPPGRRPEITEIQLELARVRREVRAGLAERLVAGLRRILKKNDRATTLAALALIGDVASQESGVLHEEGGLHDSDEVNTLRPLADDLVKLLATEKKETAVRAGAVLALCKLLPGNKVGREVLTKALAARAVGERRAAAAGLGSWARLSRLANTSVKQKVALAQEVVNLAGRGLADKDTRVRRGCLEAIRQAASLLEGLVVWPEGEPPRMASPRELAKKRKEAAAVWKALAPLARALNKQIPTLIPALKDADPAVCLAAHQALEAVVNARQRSRQYAAAAPPAPRGEKGGPDFKDLFDAAPRAVPQLTATLGRKSVRLRLAAIYVLETLGTEAASAADALVKALADRNAFVRWGAVRALGKMAPHGATRAVPGLARLLDDDSRDVRVTAVVALERYGPAAKGAVKELAAVVKGSEDPLRLLAIGALVAIGKEARSAEPALVAALSAKGNRVRAAAARALARLGARSKATRAALLEALDDPEPAVREGASAALLGEEPVPGPDPGPGGLTAEQQKTWSDYLATLSPAARKKAKAEMAKAASPEDKRKLVAEVKPLTEAELKKWADYLKTLTDPKDKKDAEDEWKKAKTPAEKRKLLKEIG
jgi:HEAT repeat protein